MFTLSACDLDFLVTAPHRFEFRLTLPACPTDVFAVVSSHEREREWFPGFASAEWLTPAPHGAGSRRRYCLKTMCILEEFLVWRPGRRLAFWVSACSLPLLERFLECYDLEPLPEGGTELHWQIVYEPNRWLQPLHPLLRPLYGRDFRIAARRLAALLGGEVRRLG